ncbi:4-hydroxybenzoyl-CoA reductase [Ruegeria marisrubri]|uniref:4-hydroxybenzoyl-CoA reductase n=1 Tax=Ruegeria marisrubri TaxID=1685379 RepID=A0A0X3U5V1_9RHOB|nr:xanthine dehydrogenase family protein subunit M [Ruegeria marisrubri]KUJ83204.1 4-hydroxybenzoyl-CoA reductase [Ruegeria marisrubri]
MRDFHYLEPRTVSEATAMLADHGEEACVFAGGTALILALRQRMMAPGVLVSLGQLEEMRAIRFDPKEGLLIGAMARHNDIARSKIVRQHYPVVAEMAGGLANPQVRNQATIGGNLCYADPSTDPPACLLALGAELTIKGQHGARRIPMDEFNVDYFTVAMEPGEILTQIRLPPPDQEVTTFYRRHLRTPAEHRPVANLALAVRNRGGAFEDVRLIVGAATPAPQLLDGVQDYLSGRSVTAEVAAEAADRAAEEMFPISDGRGDEGFRRQVVRALTRRLVAEAANLDWKETE